MINDGFGWGRERYDLLNIYVKSLCEYETISLSVPESINKKEINVHIMEIFFQTWL